MRPLRLAAAAALLLALTPRPARADGFFIPFIGYNYGGDSTNCDSLTNCNDHHTNYGVAVGKMGKVFGLEEDFSYASDFFGETPGQNNAVFTLMTNLIAGIGTGHIQPYAVGGVGLMRTKVSLNPVDLGADQNMVGWDLGFGLGIYFSKSVGIRGDLRKFHSFESFDLLFLNGQKLDFWRGSVGLALRF